MKQERTLPTGWSSVALADCVDILDNFREPINSKEREARKEGKSPNELYPYYGATGQVDVIDGYLLEGDAVLLGEDGAPFLDPRKNKAYMVTGKYWVNNHAHILRGREGVDHRFVCHQLNAVDYRPFVAGTTRLKLTQADLRRIPLLLPPSKEQSRIVAKIDELFSQIDEGERNLKRVQTLLKQYRQSVLKAAVTGQLTKDWRGKNAGKGETGADLLKRILVARREAWEAAELAKLKAKGKAPKNDDWKKKYVEPTAPDTSNLPELPKGWVWVTLLQLSHRVTDGTHQSPKFEAEGVPFIVIENVTTGSIDWDGVFKWVSEQTYLACTDKCKPERGDVLYTAVGSYGIAVPVETEERFMFQRHIAHIKPVLPQVLQSYMVHVLNSPLSLQRAHRVARGVAQKTVTLGELAQFPVPLSSESEQEEILARLRATFEAIRHLEKVVEAEAARIKSARQSVLHAAFTGRLVPQDLSDEPASELRKRIASAEVNNADERNAAPSARSRRRKNKESVAA